MNFFKKILSIKLKHSIVEDNINYTVHKSKTLFGEDIKHVWINSKGDISRIEKPAVTLFFKNNVEKKLFFYRDGKLIKSDVFPRIIEFYSNSNYKKTIFYSSSENLKCEISYFKNGIKKEEVYSSFINGTYKINRDDKAAKIEYYKNGALKKEWWYQKGVLSRKNIFEPIRTHREEDGSLISERYVYFVEKYCFNSKIDIDNLTETDKKILLEYKNNTN